LPNKDPVDDRIALVERELYLARAQLARETTARRALEDQLVEQHKQGHAEAEVPEVRRKPQEADDLVRQLLEVAASYHQTNARALELAAAAVAVVPPPSTKLDLSDPVRAITVLRSFDHDDFLAAITKSGSTIRKWQKQCKRYRESAKNKLAFRDFVVGDLALFLPTRNSPLRPWAGFNGTLVYLISVFVNAGPVRCPTSLLNPSPPREQSRFRIISFRRLVASLSS
jgi:hypothetical protein